MEEPTRILIAEDVPTDAELAEREIGKILTSYRFMRVETRGEFLNALNTFQPDLIISDYKMPSFDGLTALKITLEKSPQTPVIILTGSQNEDTAVECMKAGATDYVIKEYIKRLGSAVISALEQKRLKVEKEKAELAIRESEQRYRELVENIADIIYVVDGRGRIVFLNRATEQFFGSKREEILDRNFGEFLTPASMEFAAAVFKRQRGGEEVGVFELDFFDAHKEIKTLETREKLIWEDGRIVEVHGIGRNVTDRRRAETALRESEERYRTLLDLAPVGIAVQSEGKIVFTNPEGAKLIGAQSPKDVIGKPISEIIHPDRLEESRDRIRRMLSGEQGLYPSENIYLRPDGTPVHVDVIATPLTYQGKPAVQVIVTDISKRKEAEQAIRRSEQQYRELVENIDDIVYVTDGTGKILFLNKALERASGYLREELLETNYMDLLTTESYKKVIKLFKDQRKDKDVGVFELSIVNKDGTIKTIEIREKMIWKGNRIVEMHGLGRDVTERKRTEERIDHLNRVLLSLRNIDQLIVKEESRDRLLTGACEILCEVSGYNFAWIGLIEEGHKRVVPAAHWGFEGGYLDEITVTWDETETGKGPTGTAIRTKKPFVYQDILNNPDHFPWRDNAIKRGYQSWMAAPVMTGRRIYGVMNVYSNQVDAFDDEETKLLLEMAEDIGFALSAIESEEERRRTEVALRESEEKFRNFFETSQDVVYITSTDGKILDINSAFETTFGYTRDEALSINVSAMYKDPADRDQFQAIINEQGFVRDYEIFVRKKDGTYADCMLTSTVRKDQEGNIVGYQGTIKDVTERKMMERQLVQAEKLSSLGGILSGVAHELNNPLTSIIGNAQLIMRKPLPEDIRDKLEVIQGESHRSARIIQGLLTFAREHKPERKMIWINEVVKESCRLREYEMKVDNIGMKLDLSENIPPTAADPYQLQQVFINLINNSHDAIVTGGGSTLVIRSYVQDNVICVEFEDDGPGIPPEIAKFIFDPFFTTKEVGKGTGLGLAIVYGIIREHSGRIDVEGDKAGGAKFIVRLPITGDIVEQEVPERLSIKKPKEEKKVLVVEDEEPLRVLIGEVLTNGGYSVDESADGRQAIEMLKKKRYDIIITDLKMPGIGGKELYTFVQKYYPNLAARVVFITGDVLNKDTLAFLKITGNSYIEKPFEIETLLARVGEVI